MHPFQIKNKEVEKLNAELGGVLRELFVNEDVFPYEAAMGVNSMTVVFTIYGRQGSSIETILSEVVAASIDDKL